GLRPHVSRRAPTAPGPLGGGAPGRSRRSRAPRGGPLWTRPASTASVRPPTSIGPWRPSAVARCSAAGGAIAPPNGGGLGAIRPSSATCRRIDRDDLAAAAACGRPMLALSLERRGAAMERSNFVPSLKRLAAATHTRRSALRRVGLGGLAAGALGAFGAPLARAQDWTGGTSSAPGTPPAGGDGIVGATAAGSGGTFAGVAGGLPPFSMNLDASAPETHPAGTMRWGAKRQLPVLQGISLASVSIAPNAVQELHWHLNAHELNYVTAGSGRIGVFAADGTGQSFDVQPGSISFVPNGFTHYIQNTGPDPLQLILAFTHEQPETT